MLLQNPFYSLLREYIKRVNDAINNEYSFDTEYKSYNKDNDNMIEFKYFDIKSIIKTTSGIVVKEIKYKNSLGFLFNKYTNEVLIYHVPILETRNGISIPIFTHDIANIITKTLSKYIDCNKIKINFKDKLSPLVFDDNVESIIPSIIDTENYFITKRLLNNISKELDTIQKTIDSYKAHQDRNIKIMQKVYEKRRKVYGVDPIDYNCINEFYNAVTKALKEKLCHILKKIDRHIISTKNAYEDLFFEQFREIYNENNHYQYTKEELINKLKNEKSKNNVFTTLLNEEYFIIDKKTAIASDKYNDYDTHWIDYTKHYKILNKDIINSSENDYEIFKKCINIIWDFDINNKESGLLYLANSVRKELSGWRGEEKWHDPQDLNINFYIWYKDIHLLKPYKEKDKYQFYNWLKVISNKMTFQVPEPIFSPLFQAINLVIQYEKLSKEKEYYQNVFNNINDFTINPYKHANITGYLLHIPYFMESGLSSLYSKIGSKRKSAWKVNGSLLLIKPGCKLIDIEKIPHLFRNDNEPKKKYNLELFENSIFYKFGTYKYEVKWSTDTDPNYGNLLVITIPKSLSYMEIKKVINYFKEEYQYSAINYVCENPDVYSQVKSILIDYYLEDYKHLKNELVIKNTHICIDPNYYDEYFKNLPTAAEFFHKYDYTGNYEFRKKDILCIEDLCDIFINRCLEDNKIIDYDKIRGSILGSYSHLDNNDTFYSLDQYKYSVLNYYIRMKGKPDFFNVKDFMKYHKISKRKTLYDDFYDVLNKNNQRQGKQLIFDKSLKEIFNSTNQMIMITKDANNYRELSEEEIEKNVHKLGKIDNINVALISNSNVIIWKNFPYIPLVNEYIPLEKAKTLIKKNSVKSLPNNYELPF